MIAAPPLPLKEQFFLCLFTSRPMRNPAYIERCGHMFERFNINRWIQSKSSSGQLRNWCPLCNTRNVPVSTSDIKDDKIVQKAIQILNLTPYCEMTTVNEVQQRDTTKGRLVENAVNRIERQRADMEMPHPFTDSEETQVFLNNLKDLPENCLEDSQESSQSLGRSLARNTGLFSYGSGEPARHVQPSPAQTNQSVTSSPNEPFRYVRLYHM